MTAHGRALAVLAVAALGGLAGCARVRPNLEDLPLPTSDEILLKVENNYQELKDFAASGVAVFSGDTLPRTAAGLRVQYLRPDYLQLSLRGPVGYHLGTLILAGDRYMLDFGQSRVRTEGWVEDFEFPRIMGLELGADELLDMFLPLIHVPYRPDSVTVERDLEAQAYLLSWSDGRLDYRLWADPYEPLFTRSLILSRGDTLAYKTVSEVKRRSGVYAPQAWEVRLGQGEGSYHLKLEFREMKVNAGLKTDDFMFTAGARPDPTEVPVAP
ncbi:MAG: hypothetical protein C4524_02795 [Candidatus Zixiibacteriota bacterium]|nr:MAG: hypothetical protein C4524_02795 [candidate division Zixibacteria bacterium]